MNLSFYLDNYLNTAIFDLKATNVCDKVLPELILFLTTRRVVYLEIEIFTASIINCILTEGECSTDEEVLLELKEG